MMYNDISIALEVANVTKRFVKSEGIRWPWKREHDGRQPVVAVDRVSFQVRRGEVFGILGLVFNSALLLMYAGFMLLVMVAALATILALY